MTPSRIVDRAAEPWATRVRLLETDVDELEEAVKSIRRALYGAASSFLLLAATLAANLLSR